MNKETRNLLLFFVATFTWTWACYAPIAIGGHSPYEMPWAILLICGGMGPSLVGVAMVLLTFEKERREFWRRSFSLRRIWLPWWAVILVTFPLLFAVSIAADLALGGATPGMSELKSLLANPATLPLTVFISFLSGPWSEEFGWRGYALDPLLKRLGTIGGSCVLGLVWGVWHLPLYFMAGTWHAEMGFGLSGFWTFLVYSTGVTLLITWVYLHTNRSILAALLLHFTANFTSQLVVPFSDRVEVTLSLLVLAIGVAVCPGDAQDDPGRAAGHRKEFPYRTIRTRQGVKGAAPTISTLEPAASHVLESVVRWVFPGLICDALLIDQRAPAPFFHERVSTSLMQKVVY